MNMKKTVALVLTSCLCLTALTGCGPKEREKTPVTSESLYVDKVEGMSEDFILGMDSSAVLSLEKGGAKYYDFEGNEADVFQVLSDNGLNYIRLRVWNDPYDSKGNGYGGGNCDIDAAVEMGKRATQAGMKVLIDFHYSDFWADPNKQMVPKAWEGMDIDTKAAALGEYTTDCLNKLKDAGVDVGMVQLGNETNGSMCGEKIWMNIYKLMDAGSKAVREIFPEALIAVHFTNPEIAGNLMGFAKKLDYYQLDYDVFASSYYPYWHGTLDNLAASLSEVAETYGKKVMVAETSYAFTPEDSDFNSNTVGEGDAVDYPMTVQGQANLVRDVVDTVANKTTNGIGVFYWEGTWISAGGSSWEENSALWEEYGSGWASSYAVNYDPEDAGKYYGGCAVDNQAFFDATGHPIESLKVFGLLREGNPLELRADAVADAKLICDLNGEVVLPDTVEAIMTDNSRRAVSVAWEPIDVAAMKAGGPQKYDVKGTAEGMEAHCYVSMVEYNFLENYSFEDNEDGAPWVATALTGRMNELYVEEKPSDSVTGSKHYHFWSKEAGSVNFTLEQTLTELPAGTYRYAISIMGGDSGNSNIYAYVKINGETVATAPMTITVYNSWDEGRIENFDVAEGDTVTVGISVKCDGAGNGAWGKIDDAMVNSVSEG
ncbi:MAG: glycosyl hydrolase 53 family protein [Oscillospiraceae bacterium]|nr:glycosyl hydrolase 53 family protein [Oscillospiraceae bacterium]